MATPVAERAGQAVVAVVRDALVLADHAVDIHALEIGSRLGAACADERLTVHRDAHERALAGFFEVDEGIADDTLVAGFDVGRALIWGTTGCADGAARKDRGIKSEARDADIPPATHGSGKLSWKLLRPFPGGPHSSPSTREPSPAQIS
jgi:hypothetical protein